MRPASPSLPLPPSSTLRTVVLLWYALFVDGMQASNPVLNRLTVDEVEAIELYRGHEIPGRFNAYFSQDWNCGALVVWTKASNQP